MSTIGFIGGGNMAEALIKGIIEAGMFAPEKVLVSDIRPERLDFLTNKYGISATMSNLQVAEKVDTVVLSVKPQKMTEVLEDLRGAIGADALVVSIAAGIRVSNISAILDDMAIIRVMPNTPALIGEGTSGIFANEKAKPHLERVLAIFSSVGRAVVVEEEDLIDAVTAVSGSGPAYFFLLMEEMIKAGIELGLNESVAKDIVLQTAKGAGLLAAEADNKGESPSELRRKVTSPGGTTEAAIKVFTDGGIGDLVSAAIARARDRGRELSK